MVARLAPATEAYEQAPIFYSATKPTNAVARLEARLTGGEIRAGMRHREVLSGLLEELQIPVESQVLVFSKTSLQRHRISPTQPRAIYFSDDCQIGWVPSGLIEIASTDPLLGPVFYQLDPDAATASGTYHFKRDNDCLRCHGGTFVRDIPGLLVRSLHTDAQGEMLLQGGSELVDFRTPFTNRSGGWYVTGMHGQALHRGNVFTEEKDGQLTADFSRGANVTNLSDFFDTSRYLTNTSDIVALLVLEHQIAMQNTITSAGMRCRRMLEYQRALQRDLKEVVTEEPTYDSVRSVFKGAVQEVVEDLLFCGEATLPVGLKGTPGFQKAFRRNARCDSADNSLKDFSLEGRLFKNRCSYLIYSASFLALPPQLKHRVYERLDQVLQARSPEPRFNYLGEAERRHILRILRETHPEFSAFVTSAQPTGANRGNP